MKITLLALLSLILLSTPPSATAQQSGDFSYTSDGSAITVTGYRGSGGAVSIPDTIADLPVRAIGIQAFANQYSVTSVTIPRGVRSIGDDAFFECAFMTSVAIPSTVTNIGHEAFFVCRSLTSVAIPDSVTSIGDHALADCPGLMEISLDAANAFYSSSDGVLLNKSQTTLIQYPGGRTGSYVIPGSVASIGSEAFDYCSRLTGITIPDGVTSLGTYGFFACTSLTNITIPGSVTNIGSYAFANCTNLTRAFFKANAPNDDGYVFIHSRATVYYLPGTTGWGTTFGLVPTRLWNPLMQSSGVGPAGFGFNITGTADIPIVIEAATNLNNASWVPRQSLNLTNGAFHFSDPDWTNHPSCNYRIRSP